MQKVLTAPSPPWFKVFIVIKLGIWQKNNLKTYQKLIFDLATIWGTSGLNFLTKHTRPQKKGKHSFLELWGIFDRYAGETKTYAEIADIVHKSLEEYSEEYPSSFNLRNLFTDIPQILTIILGSEESAKKIFEQYFREDFLRKIQTKAKRNMN